MRTLLALFTLGVGAHTTAVAEHGIIIDENTLTKVEADGANVPENFRPFLNAFGLTTSGCSATHIGNGLALTAAHCHSPSPRAGLKNCGALSVWWGYRQGSSERLHSKCREIVLRKLSKNEDIMIFKIDKQPNAFVPLNTTDERPSLGAEVTIFSHPRGRPLEWSGYCSVENWPQSAKGQNQFNHRCDTEPGSSGAAMISTASLSIVGIHNGGGDGWNYASFLPAEQGSR